MFYKTPAELVGRLSAECVLIYALMYSRLRLSASNPAFHDQGGKVYIHFSVAEVRKALRSGRSKAERVLRELEANGFIRRVQPGIGLPCRIYILIFCEDTPPVDKLTPARFVKASPIGIDDYHREYERVFQRLEADVLIANRPQDEAEIEEIVRIVTDVITSTAATIRIGRENRDAKAVIAHFRRLDAACVDFVLDEVYTYPRSIENLEAFLVTALYRSALQSFRIDNQIAVDRAG